MNKRNRTPRRSDAKPDNLESELIDDEDDIRQNIQQEKSLFSRFYFVLKHLWIVGLFLLAGLFISIGYLFRAVPIYQSTVVLQVAQQQVRVFDAKDNPGSGEDDDLRGDDILNTITQSLKLQSLYERVANDPSIQQDINIVPAPNSGSPSTSVEDLANEITKATTVTLRHRTRLIDVSVVSPVPETAQKLANAVVDQFISASAENDIGTSSAKRKFLLDEVARTKIDLQKVADGLEIYKEALRQKQRVDDQQKVVDDLSQRYLDAHPKLIEARSLMTDLKLGFDEEIKKVIANSPTEADYWTQNEKSLPPGTQDDLITSELKLVEARTSVLQTEVDTESALFDSLLKQMREENVNSESAPEEVKIVDPANLPKDPISPNKLKVIMIGVMAGLGFGLVFVLFLQRIDSSLGSAEETEMVTGLPVIATIPLLAGSHVRKQPSRKDGADFEVSFEDKKYDDIVLLTDPSGIASENFRNFRAAMELIGKEEDRRVTLISSALPGEGKTFTSSNYAVSLAQQGLKTLLIDADLRRPGVHGRFHLKNDRPGFTEYVSRGMSLNDVIRFDVTENLDIMLTGGKCPNPSEFLGGKGFAETLQSALLHYDRVVVDSPPINLVSDTRLIAPYVQTVCLVIKAESTSKYAVLRALDFLEKAHAKTVGIVFNCVPKWSIDQYYGYYYSSKYKYGEAYGEK